MFGGIINGVGQMAAALLLAIAIIPEKPEAARDFSALANQWLVDAKRISLWNRDPFNGSRELWHVIKMKYGA